MLAVIPSDRLASQALQKVYLSLATLIHGPLSPQYTVPQYTTARQLRLRTQIDPGVRSQQADAE
jgi:hypothetical protein